MEYGLKIIKLLEALSEAPDDTLDFISAFLRSGYGASFKKLQYELEQGTTSNNNTKREAIRINKRRLSHVIYNLKKDGIIETQQSPSYIKNTIITLTHKGLLFLKKRKKEHEIKQAKGFIKKSNKTKIPHTIIISFDIPEKLNIKRKHLRAILYAMGFAPIQKSVWVGTGAVTKEFIHYLNDEHIMDGVDIFIVTKQGTLRHHYKNKEYTS